MTAWQKNICGVLGFWLLKESGWFGVVKKKKERGFYCILGLYEQYHKREKRMEEKNTHHKGLCASMLKILNNLF